ncbi:GntR family transcriptional regulator [Erysipelothrix inopinata]|uniref:GntR family transcriptional regulator n=1 Tax=Erysipelothrix inopinata TaxID=225084 RepID=A0A7G9S169_9FIRM|nr:GntR family transcriptional regulator [Erysipelothrix inopinata]QNN61594.1 GntR family transcriptional regulator [Erysipelothrix inopinata]
MAVPIYLQIKEDLINHINEAPANSPLDSERDLAILYRASRMTVRRAIDELVNEGYLYREANKGTFVANRSLHRKNSLEYDDSMDVTLLYFDVKARADVAVQKALALKNDDQIIKVTRLLSQNSHPIAVEELYFKRRDFSDKEMEIFSKAHELNEFMARGTTHYEFHAALVPVQYMKMLKIKMNTPIIEISRMMTSKDGLSMGYGVSYYNPDTYKVEVTL